MQCIYFFISFILGYLVANSFKYQCNKCLLRYLNKEKNHELKEKKEEYRKLHTCSLRLCKPIKFKSDPVDPNIVYCEYCYAILFNPPETKVLDEKVS